LAKGLGSGIKEFKKASREVTDEIQNAATDTPPAKPVAPAPPSQTISQSSNPPKA
jgi:Sec-independent protein translocase protein TatA